MNRIAIIGAGKGGTELLKIFNNDPLVKVIKIADENPNAPGIKLARKLGIPTTTDFRKLLKLKNLNTLINVTGSPDVEYNIKQKNPPGVAVIGGLEAKFMWQLIEAKIKSKDELQSHLIEYQDLVRLYLRDARHAVIDERTRIAMDLHDGLVQTLVGLNYKMDLLEQKTVNASSDINMLLQEVRSQLKSAIEESRYVVFNLKPIYFEKMDLMPALRNYLKSYEKQAEISTTLKVVGEEVRIPARAKVFLFRIVQESLSNVKRHSNARHVLVEIRVRKNNLNAMIRDNGIGFDIEKVKQDPMKWASFGVRGIEERAKLLGGTASIESLKGKGTTVYVSLPLKDRDELISKLEPEEQLPVKKRLVSNYE